MKIIVGRLLVTLAMLLTAVSEAGAHDCAKHIQNKDAPAKILADCMATGYAQAIATMLAAGLGAAAIARVLAKMLAAGADGTARAPTTNGGTPRTEETSDTKRTPGEPAKRRDETPPPPPVRTKRDPPLRDDRPPPVRARQGPAGRDTADDLPSYSGLERTSASSSDQTRETRPDTADDYPPSTEPSDADKRQPATPETPATAAAAEPPKTPAAGPDEQAAAEAERDRLRDRLRGLGDKLVAGVDDPERRTFYEEFMRRHGDDPEKLRRAIDAVRTQMSAAGDQAASDAAWWGGLEKAAADIRDWSMRTNRILAKFAPGGGAAIVGLQGGGYAGVQGYEEGGAGGALARVGMTGADLFTGGMATHLYDNKGNVLDALSDKAAQYDYREYQKRIRQARDAWQHGNYADAVGQAIDTGLDATDAAHDVARGVQGVRRRLSSGGGGADEQPTRRAPDEPENRRRADDADARRRADEAESRRKADADAETRRQADEAEARRRTEEEGETKRKADEAEAKRKSDEVEAKRQAEEAEARRKAEEAEANRQAEEVEAKRQAEEAEAKRKAEEAEAKRQAEEAEAKRQAEEAEAKRKAEEAEAKRQAEEAEAKRQAEEAEAKRKADAEAEAEAKRKADAEEEAKRRQQEEDARRAAEEAARRRDGAADAAKREAEEAEKKRQAEEADTKREADGSEAERKAEATRKAEETKAVAKDDASQETPPEKKLSPEELKERLRGRDPHPGVPAHEDVVGPRQPPANSQPWAAQDGRGVDRVRPMILNPPTSVNVATINTSPGSHFYGHDELGRPNRVSAWLTEQPGTRASGKQFEGLERGHLVPGQYGGRGDVTVPMTRECNRSHVEAIEQAAKPFLEKGYAVRLDVEVEYPHGSTGTMPGQVVHNLTVVDPATGRVITNIGGENTANSRQLWRPGDRTLPEWRQLRGQDILPEHGPPKTN
jgi:hypothetical protein